MESDIASSDLVKRFEYLYEVAIDLSAYVWVGLGLMSILVLQSQTSLYAYSS